MNENNVDVFGRNIPQEDAIFDSIGSLMDSVEDEDSLKKSKYIILKPNYVVADHWTTGNTTCPIILEALIDYIQEKLPNAELAVGEGGFTRLTKKAFKVNGLPDLCNKKGINLIDFNDDEHEAIIIPGAHSLVGSIKIAREAIKCDSIISVPSLKTHSLASTTLSIKNFMGALGRKSIMHSNIHHKIVDLFSYFHNKAPFAIIDGYYGSEGYECGGNPIKHDIILASKDLVALDTTGAAIMGQNVNHSAYLANASARSLGISNIEQIKCIGFNLEKMKKNYCEG